MPLDSSSPELPGPRWDEAHLRRWLGRWDWKGELPPVAWFGDGPEASELAELVRKGEKRATAGLLWRWLEQGGLPEPGDRQVIVDWQGRPRAVIEITSVTVAAFDEVDDDFAREEGEGDLSLGHWRRVHWAFFTRECERLGRTPDPKMPVVCMRFRRLHPPTDPYTVPQPR